MRRVARLRRGVSAGGFLRRARRLRSATPRGRAHAEACLCAAVPLYLLLCLRARHLSRRIDVLEA
jgi:hypothetical protein